MRSFLVRRTVYTLATLWVVASLMFILFRLMPADPTAAVISPALEPEVREAMAAQFGLDEPLHVQYVAYLVNAIQFDFGQSFFRPVTVRSILAERVVNTFVMMIVAIVFAFSIGTALGALAAWRKGSLGSRSSFIMAILFRSIPAFLAGLIFLYVFAFWLDLLPLGGMVGADAEFDSRFDMFLSFEFVRHLLLPVLSVTPFIMAFPILLMRTTMLEVINEDYIHICRAKGVPERRILTRHALRNSVLPILTTMPIVLGAAVAGNILIETIYSWPGIGRTLVRAVMRGDFPLAQGTFLLIAVIVIFGNFLVDILYTVLDPRIRYQ